MSSAQQRADAYEDLAGSLEAGLPLAAGPAAPNEAELPNPAGGGSSPRDAGEPADSDRPGDELLARVQQTLGMDLPMLDRAVFRAAGLAGELPRALRQRADAWRTRVEMRRVLLGRCAYPALLLAAAVGVVVLLIVLGTHVPPGLLIGEGLALALFVGVPFLVTRRALRSASHDATKLPVVGRLFLDLAIAPYLEALSALLGAGVRIDRAHRQAADTAGTVYLRARLRAASRKIDEGHSLRETLEGLVPAELSDPLGTAEQAGELVAATDRLATRHRERAARQLSQLARVAGSLAFLLAASLVAGIAFSFYADYFDRIRSLSR